MANNLGTPTRPLRVAIIGSGPSGFYAAETLISSGNIATTVDMFDRLPTPFGLVRYGVAPDHPKIKNVIKVYEKIAANPKFAFLGNVRVGRDISVDDLRKHYDVVVFACGAETDKHLGIPGEDLPGNHTATEFVAWYNGHPDHRHKKFDLSSEVAVVIGQGNVSMDVSRILCKTADELKNTDMASYAIEALVQSKIKEVHLIGRRGPVQAAFTPAEIKEFGELLHCDPVFNNLGDFNLNPESQRELDDPNDPIVKKNWEILQEYGRRPPASKPKKFIIHFLESPVEIKGNGKVESLIFEKNKLVGEPENQKAVGTGTKVELKCGLVLRSVGYRGVAIPGVPFDEAKGIFPNKDGRILDGDKIISGLYAVGWIKRGPSGVIGTNKADSDATVKNIFSDIAQLSPCQIPNPTAVHALLKSKNIQVVTFSDWQKIDRAEIERGKLMGKPREKFTSIEEMLKVAGERG